jgi:hypothetical protein
VVRIVTVTQPGFNVEVVTPDPAEILVAPVLEDLFVGSPGEPGPPGAPGQDGQDGNAEEEMMLDLETDESVPGVVYLGQAVPGTETNQPLWRIRKITEGANGTSIDWANGSSLMDQVWDDRLSLTYGP